MVRGDNIDLIDLVETFKSSFSPNELPAVAGADRLDWTFLPSSGHSGGILIGSKRYVFDFMAFDHGIFRASIVVHHHHLNALWEAMVVYGPADHSLSPLFLDEITSKIESCSIPLLIGGDFNLLRSPPDKNTPNFSWPLVDAFNDFISNCALREIPRVGSRFTWMNHQISPIRSVLGRVFVCPKWDTLFPLDLLKAKPIVGSDHAHLILDAGLQNPSNPPRFQFDACWLLIDGFCVLLSSKILALLSASAVLSGRWMTGIIALTLFASFFVAGPATMRQRSGGIKPPLRTKLAPWMQPLMGRVSQTRSGHCASLLRRIWCSCTISLRSIGVKEAL